MLAGIFTFQACLFGAGFYYCAKAGGLSACPKIGERYESTFNVMIATDASINNRSLYKGVIMFEKSDFELSLETELKQRVILDEIDHCEDVKALQENLKNVTKLFMTYQHLLNTVIAKQIEKNMIEMFQKFEASDV